MSNIFKLAAKQKLRFQTTKGPLSVEQLFDLPLDSQSRPSLNQLYIQLSEEVKAAETRGLMETTRKSDVNTLRLQIVEAVFNEKRADNAAKSAELSESQKRAHIKQLIAQKKDEELAGKTVEELEAMLKGE